MFCEGITIDARKLSEYMMYQRASNVINKQFIRL